MVQYLHFRILTFPLKNVPVLAKPIGPERRQNALPAYLFRYLRCMSKQIHPIHHFFPRVGLEYCEKDAQEMQGCKIGGATALSLVS